MPKNIVPKLIAVVIMLTFLPLAYAAIKDVVEMPGGDRGPVKLTHAKHSKLEGVTCKTCHHKMEGDTPKKLCRDCHNKSADKKVGTLKDALHKSCQGCHKEMKKAGKPTGPTMKCFDCHQKQKKAKK